MKYQQQIRRVIYRPECPDRMASIIYNTDYPVSQWPMSCIQRYKVMKRDPDTTNAYISWPMTQQTASTITQRTHLVIYIIIR